MASLIQQTVVLVKPDGVQKGLVGDILKRFEVVGLKIVALKMIRIDAEIARKHYPIKRAEWIESIGIRALEDYRAFGRDPGEDLDTLNPKEIGELMAKWLVDFLTEGPIVAVLLEGEAAISVVRKIVGHTFGEKALPGTIRGDYSSQMGLSAYTKKKAGRNLVHASGNAQEAEFEKQLWFKEKEIYKYKRVGEDL